ncbi:anaphase-promoting complex, subunit 10-domain-containing protein, partial [Jimgerdemannia flammicorona]
MSNSLVDDGAYPLVILGYLNISIPVPETGTQPIADDTIADKRDIGGMAIWSLSSCKAGFGVEQLRDDSKDTYWQSDGPQPHLVNIQFSKKTTVKQVSIYTDYKQDESYTPSKISVRAGTGYHDLQVMFLIFNSIFFLNALSVFAYLDTCVYYYGVRQEIQVIELEEPVGWEHIILYTDDRFVYYYIHDL